MGSICELCGKSAQTGFRYSHSHIRTKRRWLPNLHRVKARVDGTPRRIYVCTRCLRSDKVQRAL
ncbi:MAG: 50S ribosomal protein L28 [bacterium]|nr:50S ribosomal protein L28 [bacterium]